MQRCGDSLQRSVNYRAPDQTRGVCNWQAAGQRTLAPFCSAYGWLITRIESIRLKRGVTKTTDDDDINITHSGNKHAQLTLNQSNLLRVTRKLRQRCNKFTAIT